MRKLLSTVLIVFSAAAFGANLTVNDYVDAGLPAPSREWQGADYLRTVQVLSIGQIDLPRYSEDAGAKLMERFVSLDNLSFYRNRSVPLQNRLGDFINILQGSNNLMKMYFGRLSKGDRLQTELADLLAFSLHVSALGVELINEYLPTIPKDKNYAERMVGVNQMYSGMTTQFNGAEIALTEDTGLSTGDRTVILNAMVDTLPTLKKAFPGDFRSELRRKLEADKRVLKGISDSKTIERMLNELKS